MEKLTISVIGAGALGKTYGGVLALAGHSVHFLLHSEYENIREAGFFELDFKPGKNLKVVEPNIYAKADELPPSDLVIIALKTTQNNQAAELLRTCVQKNTIILIIQNGIGNEEFFHSIFPDNKIICGISTFGATRENALHTRIYDGESKLAPFKREEQQCCDEIADVFKKAFESIMIEHKIKVFEDCKSNRWHKILWNATFGPLSIIYDSPVDVLIHTHQEKIRELMFEIKEVAIKEGVNIEASFIDKMIKETGRFSHYYPSMYIDYEKGRAIEKEYLFDNILKIAEKNNVNVPLLREVKKSLSKLIGE